MNQMKRFFKIIGLCFCLVLFCYGSATGFTYLGEDISFVDYTPLYSFTDPIEYYALSKNNEKLVIQVNSKQTQLKKLYITNSNGTGLTEVFSDGNSSLKQFGFYLEMKHLKPVISGNGEVVIQGVIPTQAVDKKSDYLLIYYPKTKRSTLVSLKILYPGCSVARFSQGSSSVPYTINFNGTKVIACVEMGSNNGQCDVFDSMIVSMNADGSNQSLVYGPSDFSPVSCRFTWKNYPTSPRNPIISYNGEKIFFYASMSENTGSGSNNGDIFVINTDGANVRQLTFSKRLDPKPEQAGPFLLNYYGSRLYYQVKENDRFSVMSIGLDGSLPEKYFSFPEPLIFTISTDGKKIFFSHPEKNQSLVYFDLTTQRIVTLLDLTKPKEQTNYGLLAKFSFDDLVWTNTSDFSGNSLTLCLDREWIVKCSLSNALVKPLRMEVLFQVNYPVVSVNYQLISLSASPYIKNNRIMIPSSVFFQSFGFPYQWHTKEQVLEARQYGNVYQIHPAKKLLLINGKTVKTGLSSEMMNNQIFIPGYWAKDYFGLSIRWDSKQQILAITR